MSLRFLKIFLSKLTSQNVAPGVFSVWFPRFTDVARRASSTAATCYANDVQVCMLSDSRAVAAAVTLSDSLRGGDG